jgi:hypothetical protein
MLGTHSWLSFYMLPLFLVTADKILESAYLLCCYAQESVRSWTPGTGHASFYTIPIGHSGWAVKNQFFGGFPNPPVGKDHGMQQDNRLCLYKDQIWLT